jgi:CheY-specific phosphatase CheX
MRHEYIEPVVNACMGTLASVIRSDVKQGKVSAVPGEERAADIAVVVGLHGDSEGHIALHMGTVTAVNIAARLFETEFDALTPAGLDALAELANMVAGNVVSSLNERGFDFSMTPPRVLAAGQAPGKAAGPESFRIPFTTDCGEVTVQAAFHSR